MDTDTIRKVAVADKTAVSKSDILGRCAVVIESHDRMDNIQIKRKKER